jgi:hypothetical protein
MTLNGVHYPIDIIEVDKTELETVKTFLYFGSKNKY